MTVDDLSDELRRQAGDAPYRSAVLATADRIYRERARRRRRTALIAAAASVVVLVVGVGLAVNAFRPGQSAPAAPPEPAEIELPADTQLERANLPAVISPVATTAPAGLTNTHWMANGESLAVNYFAEPDQVGLTGRPLGAGYRITAEQFSPATVLEPGDDPMSPTPVTPVMSTIEVGGRTATLVTGTDSAVDDWGLPADSRISWQLGDGRWIQLWGEGTSGRDLARELAETVIEQPTRLERTIDIGVTLPGLTSVSTSNATLVGPSMPMFVYQCPAGVDPFIPVHETSSGSGSSGPPDEVPESTGASTSPAATYDESPWAACLVAGVTTGSLAQFEGSDFPLVGSGSSAVRLTPDRHSAIRDLGNGLLAIVNTPSTGTLSDQDLAAAVLSIRVAPDVVVIADDGFGSESSSVSASAVPSAMSSSAPTG